ncbi:tripartite motif-containing protein 54 [Strongylocentrotus purpuratus]|uniref:Uncharacterized protein n=1 Tax=Strongylocentrotus purpuratus TaxID=7668 RepID=A0A7M7NG15_STRPU|nr:tripartite motif-containing protein 54 [Strongylocentrotus purpuratus]
MAEKTEEKKAPSSLENLTCPLCLDIFDEATILSSCGHTFCRKCLKNYDLSHQDLDHMICPLCRKITKLSVNRVDDFLTNVTVNGLVDNYHVECGGDIISGKVSIGHLSEKCCIHKQENKDMFCEDCKVHVCFKCVIVGHQIHNIKNQADVEQQLRLKVNGLVQRCAAKKTELEKNIHNVEVQRHEVYTAVQKLLDDVSQAYSIKAKELEENHRNLIEHINAVKRSFDDELNVLKSKDRQRIKIICSSKTLVANDRLGRLETDSLSAHTLLCEELDAMLKEATDHTSAAAITKKAQEKRFKPAYDTRLDLGCISESDPKLQVIQFVDLQKHMSGITQYSDDSVAIGYWDTPGIDIIDSAGTKGQYPNIPENMKCYDVVFQQDRSLCISTSSTEAHIYSPNGSRKSTIHLNNAIKYNLNLNRSPSDEILIANGENKVYIYDPTGSTLKHTAPTKHNETSQVSATRSGLIVTSCCSNPSVVTVYDRGGNAGKSLQAPSDVNLYAAVDEQDRVYVASVNYQNGNVVIRLYELDGLNLKERVEYNVLNLTLGDNWCYLVPLSPDMLAFASNKKLYFIKVSS